MALLFGREEVGRLFQHAGSSGIWQVKPELLTLLTPTRHLQQRPAGFVEEPSSRRATPGASPAAAAARSEDSSAAEPSSSVGGAEQEQANDGGTPADDAVAPKKAKKKKPKKKAKKKKPTGDGGFPVDDDGGWGDHDGGDQDEDGSFGDMGWPDEHHDAKVFKVADPSAKAIPLDGGEEWPDGEEEGMDRGWPDSPREEDWPEEPPVDGAEQSDLVKAEIAASRGGGPKEGELGETEEDWPEGEEHDWPHE